MRLGVDLGPEHEDRARQINYRSTRASRERAVSLQMLVPEVCDAGTEEASSGGLGLCFCWP
jgi:hypothetical protein